MSVRLSNLQPAALYLQEFWYSFLLDAESTQGNSVAERIRSLEKSNDIVNQARNLPACSTVPHPTMLLYASSSIFWNTTQCSLMNCNQCFRGTSHLHLQGWETNQSRLKSYLSLPSTCFTLFCEWANGNWQVPSCFPIQTWALGT
jgi:hypothetical protein